MIHHIQTKLADDNFHREVDTAFAVCAYVFLFLAGTMVALS